MAKSSSLREHNAIGIVITQPFQAKRLFAKMYPNDEFLPRAPDPEEIIIGEDDEPTDGSNVDLNDIKSEQVLAQLDELSTADDDVVGEQVPAESQ